MHSIILFALVAHATTLVSAQSFTVAPPSGATLAPRANAYSTTYAFGHAPAITEQGQSGTSDCGTGSNSSSLCQTLVVNSVQDFCLYGPPVGPGETASISADERIEVAYCLNAGYGTRVFPEGTILGAHFVMTPDYVQISGNGDFTKIGVVAGDEGGELDPHGADGNGNPIGALVFGNSYGKMQQYHEWTNFMSATEFCIRACNPAGPNPAEMCNHVFDVLGCEWNMPANYENGYFEDCLGDSGLPMGVYGASTFSRVPRHRRDCNGAWGETGESDTFGGRWDWVS